MICDVQKEYAECLFRILTERLSDRYQFHLFTDAHRMVEFTEQAGAAILLVSEAAVRPDGDSLREGGRQ